jgi:acyl-coenzyme A synthetase/AMP-(fatty) acid ligase
MIHKVPEQLEIVAELPRNPSGKVLKHELRNHYSG